MPLGKIFSATTSNAIFTLLKAFSDFTDTIDAIEIW